MAVARNGDALGAIALAVVELAAKEAQAGDAEARAWVAELRADLLDAAPPALRARYGATLDA
jgi:hypothetical protein